MNLKESAKNHILSSLLTHQHGDWHILAIHEPTAHILTTLFSFSELISHNLLAIQRIEDANRNAVPENPCLYFIKPDASVVKTIIKDHSKKMYKKYSVYFTSQPASNLISKLEKLENPNVVVKIINIEFSCFDNNVFICDFNALKTVALVSKNIFNITCLNENDKKDADALEEIFSAENRQRKGDLILMNRFDDMVTPLMRFFSFQSLLNDFKLIKNNFYEQKQLFFEDVLWQRIRFKHIAEINKVLSKEAQTINDNVKKLKDANTKDLIKMVYEAPEQIQLKQEISIFLDLLDQCITNFESLNLNFLSLTEQNIVTKKDVHGNKYQKGVEDFFKVCNDEKIGLTDKLRLFCLLSMKYDWQKKEEDLLIKMKIVDKNDLKTDKCSLLNALIKNRDKQFCITESEKIYDISRYKTVLENVIDNFVNKKVKYINLTNVTQESQTEVQSLRKSEFVFKKQTKVRKMICIYIKGGLTYEEIRVVTKESQKNNIDIILGSDEVLTHEKFLDNLRNWK
ncbi:Syntaxin-binding protein 3 [Conglomerata obtusa]